MARTRDIAPYPSPSPKLYDEEVPKLADQDLRDGYDKQFRINQRLKRWGITIADIINALDIGGWDPSTKVVWVGDGEDADYGTITEALLSISPSSFDPRLLVVFPGAYFDRLYIPNHTSIYGLGQREMIKVWVDGNNNETMIEGGNQNIHLANLDIQQRKASATGTKVIELSATDVSFDNVYVENKATDADSEVVIVNNSSLTTGKSILLNNVHIKGNNASVDTAERGTYVAAMLDLWAANNAVITGSANAWKFRTVGAVTPIESTEAWNETDWQTVDAASPFGDDAILWNGAQAPGTNLAQYFHCTANLLTGAQADAADAVTLSFYIKYMAPSAYAYSHLLNIGAIGIFAYVYENHLHVIKGALSGGPGALTPTNVQVDIDCGIFLKGVWHRITIAYDKNSGDFIVYDDEELIGYANSPAAYIYGGGTAAVRIQLGAALGTNPPKAYWSEIIAWNSFHYPWEIEKKTGISTLRLSSDIGVGTAQGNVRLNNVLVENDTPNRNIIIGDVPFELHGVVSKLAQGNNESKNITVRNDIDNHTVHIFGGVTSLYGEHSLVFDTPRSRVTANRGGFSGNRPIYIPPAIKRAFLDEDWTQRPSEGQLSAHDFFEGNYLGDKNILYHGELDAGRLMPEPTTKHFNDVQLRELEAERLIANEIFGFDQTHDYDTEGFRYPYTRKEDEGGGFIGDLVTKTGNYTVTATNHTIICNATGGSFTITLPAVASHEGRIYCIKKIDSSANTVTVDGNGSETIDDATTAVLTTQYESITIQSDGSEWWII